MTGPYDPQRGQDEYDPELAAILSAAMRSEADRVVPVGDGLAKIRARTEGRASLLGWFTRPAAAGGIVAVALVAATVVGVQLADDGGGTDSVIADPKQDPVIQPFASTTVAAVIENDQSDVARTNPTPQPEIGPTGGDDFPVNTELTTPAPFAAKIAPVTEEQERNRSDNGIPVDTGSGSYVSIEGPYSGGTYGSPLTLAGRARVYEGNVTIDISQNGTVLKQGHATATEAAPATGDWQATFELAPGNYRIDAYALSPKDGETKLFSDSIWITIRSNTSTPTPTGSARPSSTPSARPTSTSSPVATTQSMPGSDSDVPQSDVPGNEVPATEQ